MSTIIEALREFIARECLNGNDDGLEANTPLLEWGVIDSITIMSLTQFVSERFGVRIPNAELKPANLATLTAIAATVDRLRQERAVA